jgi:hypothetical protein
MGAGMRARRPWVRVLPYLVVLSFAASSAWATTWVDVDVTCPVCGAVNTFQMPASFGTYVYREPSRLQYVFWPSTTDRFLYTCKRCHLTAYMGDFEDIPKSKVPALQEMLSREARIDGDVVPYFRISMPLRLAIAEKVYEVLGRDEVFWCEFHRIEGFHLEEAGLDAPAREARTKALALAEKRLQAPSDPGTRKETLVIVASMRYFTGDRAGCEGALSEAAGLKFHSNDLGPESSAGLDRFLDELIGTFRSELLAP